MWKLPPVPGLDGLHPLIVHFPIALFIVAPLFVLAALVLWKRRLGALSAAAALLVLATAALFITVASGQAAGELAERTTPAVNSTIERHEEMAQSVQVAFSILTGVLLALLAVGAWLKDRVKRPLGSGVLAAYLAGYAVCLLLLVNTAHQGGRLVHELGVRAMMAGPADRAAALDHD